MILTDTMLDAAYQFREAEPWKELTDSDIFAIKLSDDTTVYCSIMGHGGAHHSLGIYIGDKGFSTYLKTLAANNMSMLEGLETSIEFDCINCDFMQAKDIKDNVKKIIRSYAERKSIKIPRKNGWIDFTRFTPYKEQWCITDEHDALVAEEALKAAAFFAKEFNGKPYSDVYLDPFGEYPTPQGGKQIPLITTDENGNYSISTTTTPPLVEKTYIAPKFDNDILIHKVKAIKKSGKLECRLQSTPMPVGNNGDDAPNTVSILIIAENTGNAIPMPISTSNYPEDTQVTLAELANHLCSIGMNPEQITVCDDKTYNMIEDFCKKCKIKLKKVRNLPEIEDMCMAILQGMMMGFM